MKILFISRAYPPITGGIENQNYALSVWLPKITETTTIANRFGKAGLPLFIPRVLIQSLWQARKFDAILLGDGVLAPVGAVLKICYPSKIVASVLHGLDITFATKEGFLSKLYALVNIPCLKTLDRLICVSEETLQTAVRAGIDAEAVEVIHNGIDPEAVLRPTTRQELEQLLGMSLVDKYVILRTGRYVAHKGVEWFIREVMPILPKNIIFVAAGAVVKKNTPGDTDYFPLCEKAVQELDLSDNVKLMTNLPWEHMQILFNSVDVVVSPNIPIPGSMEGFGLTVLEAAICERPVVASDLEGLKDALTHKQNGILVAPLDALAYKEAILTLLNDDQARLAFGVQAAVYTEEHYHWHLIAKKYVAALANHQRQVQ
ncbi:MAG: glycosyltransferase family 4 protein [Patescibacteria group bacterium]